MGTVVAIGGPEPDQAHLRLGRVGDRASFVALARTARRARRGDVSVRYLPPGSVRSVPSDRCAPARCALLVDRRAGNAVVRNRIRRRVRAALRTLAQQDRLPAGTYLVRAGAGAVTSPWAVLVDDLGAAVLAAAAQP